MNGKSGDQRQRRRRIQNVMLAETGPELSADAQAGMAGAERGSPGVFLRSFAVLEYVVRAGRLHLSCQTD